MHGLKDEHKAEAEGGAIYEETKGTRSQQGGCMLAAVACAERLRTERGRQQKLEMSHSPRTLHCRAKSRCAYLAVWLCFCKWLCKGDLEGPLRLCKLGAILHSDLVAWEALLDMSSVQEGVLQHDLTLSILQSWL